MQTSRGAKLGSAAREPPGSSRDSSGEAPESAAGSLLLQPPEMGIHALEDSAMAVFPCAGDANEHRVVCHAEDSTSAVAFVVPRELTSFLILGRSGEPGASRGEPLKLHDLAGAEVALLDL